MITLATSVANPSLPTAAAKPALADSRLSAPAGDTLRQAQDERQTTSLGAHEVRSAGLPQASTAPAGGSDDTSVRSVGAHEVRSAGPPQASTAPSGGSDDTSVRSVGAHESRSAGPPQASTARPGGGAARGATSASVPLLGFGQVRHTRLKPARNAFAYPTYFLMLPLRSMKAQGNGPLARNRRAALSFFDSDHGDGRADCVSWLDDLLHSEGIDDAAGELWLHTYPRIFGHTFKPVSFWYCHRVDSSLRAIVVEVNNTFGERHCYLLDHPHYGQELSTDKVFHVSPFCTVEGRYRFRFMRINHEELQQTVARIDYDDADGPLLETSVSGTLVPLSPASLRRALWRYPAMTFGVVARIHWQAFRLWCKRIPFVRKPKPPENFVTR